MRTREERIARWEALHGGRRAFVYLIECPFDEIPGPYPRTDIIPERLDAIKAGFDRQTARARWLNDDRLPSVGLGTGTEIFAHAFGCDVRYPEDNMPFALPLVHSAAEADRLRIPDIWDCPITYLFDMADKLMAHAGAGALMRLPDIQSPMDITSLIWDKNDLYTAMLDTPEAVRTLAGKVYAFQTAFLDAWFARYGTAFIAHYPYYYMNGGVTLSEDEIGAVGAGMFDDLFIGELNALSRRYGGIGIHCCADARHQWDGLLRVEGLKVVNLVNKPAMIADSIDVFAGVIQIPDSMGDRITYNRPEAYAPGMRAVLSRTAESRDEALRLAGAWERLP